MMLPGVHRILLLLHQGILTNSLTLLDLTKKSTSWHWSGDQQKAFKELKNWMCR